MLAYTIDLNTGACACGLGRLGQIQPLGVVVIAGGNDVRVSIPIKVTDANFQIVRNSQTRHDRETLVEGAAAAVQENGCTPVGICQNHIRKPVLVEIPHL
jgi:hypothetical protein